MARGSNFVKLAGLLAGVPFFGWLLVFFWFDLFFFFGLGVFQERNGRHRENDTIHKDYLTNLARVYCPGEVMLFIISLPVLFLFALGAVVFQISRICL